VKYADGVVLLVEEEPVLQGMTDTVIEIGRCYGMEINVDNAKQ
jgi:hypothetical protein